MGTGLPELTWSIGIGAKSLSEKETEMELHVDNRVDSEATIA